MIASVIWRVNSSVRSLLLRHLANVNKMMRQSHLALWSGLTGVSETPSCCRSSAAHHSGPLPTIAAIDPDSFRSDCGCAARKVVWGGGGAEGWGVGRLPGLSDSTQVSFQLRS